MKTFALIQAEIPDKNKSKILAKVKIDSRGCWIWQGARNDKGYGKMAILGRTIGTHRISYAVFNGDISEGLYVCHKCDVPACVNPEHLFLGTCKDNVLDSFNKGRDNKKGKKLSPEHREQVCKNLVMGRPTDEARAKISAWHKGRPKSEEAKANMRKPKSERGRANISRSNQKKAVNQLGSKNPATKLKEQDVLEIRKIHKAGSTIAALAREYKVGESTIRRIVKGRLWTHI